MKKLIIPIVLLATILSSCNNDDNQANDNSNNSPIVGVWNLVKEVNVCASNNNEVTEYSECQQKTRITFLNNGNYNESVYNFDNDECKEIYKKDGTWTLDESNLTVKIEGDTNKPTFFELSDNVLRFGYYTTDSNCSDDTTQSHYYSEYVKVQ